jgi:signal transduction histidine kinase
MGPLNENQMHFLNVVKTNSNRLMDLINDILIISRIESGKIKLQFKLVDIKEVILDVVQSLKLEADGKNLSVTMEIAEGLPLFKADEKRLTQIVFNLFSNAVKYTFEGGRIVVRAFLNPAQMVQVEVEDTGVGMTPEQCEKLFRPFYRADNPLREIAGGTGLGLSITKSLVEQHGGEMWVTSEQDKGSTFSFIMPLEQPERSEDEADGDDE